MISNPNLILYACIAKGPTILAEFSSSKESGLDTIAQRCIEKTPPNHSIFSHTIRNKTYTFLIDDPFAYFAIFDENLEKSESFWFLNRVKNVFEEFLVSNSIKDIDKPTTLCFQAQFYPLLTEILAVDVDLVNSLMEENNDSRNLSLDSNKTKRALAKPLLSKPNKVLMMKKKKKRATGEANGDHRVKDGGNVDNKVGENGIAVGNREFSVLMMQKGGGLYLGDGKQKAKQIWRKHVWVVLLLDLVVCAVLFGVWLWVCRGFKCIDG